MLTALWGGEAAIFISGYECNSPAAPSDFDRLISEYRLKQGYRLIGRTSSPVTPPPRPTKIALGKSENTSRDGKNPTVTPKLEVGCYCETQENKKKKERPGLR